ncbi:MAG: type II toxin-antitoxin system ParD family antitoxin [gamma proteobacterium symbiont of Taylorina sp.]|nr:type II toxin-antitoxin system ParD family antitoxin [gamma proteobacterium symbiont of Taylorina sp.]
MNIYVYCVNMCYISILTFNRIVVIPRTISITLGKHQQHFIESLVKSGHYTSISEIIRDTLPKMEESQGSEWLLSQLIEGEKGEAKAWDDEALIAHIKKEAKNSANL